MLFAIRKPSTADLSNNIEPFDTRPFSAIYDHIGPDRVAFYSSPDVSERLRIQRGHFLLGQVSATNAKVGISLTIEDADEKNTWLNERMDRRGRPGRYWRPMCDIGTFRIPPQHKASLRAWLESRTGLTADFVYPTAWHQPHLEMFAKSHGRMTPY